MQVIDVEQRSEEWMAIRAGKVTASRVSDVVAKIKCGESASRRNYRAQLVSEILTGKVEEGYTSKEMLWGIEQEPFARAMYEASKGVFVQQVGFCPHPTIIQSGASPDGLIDIDGLLEIKSPNTATHIDYLLAGVPPPQHIPQMAWQCACTGRKWVDFVSYDPRLPEELQLFVVRCFPEPDYIRLLEAEVTQFLNEVNTTVEQLRQIMKKRAA